MKQLVVILFLIEFVSGSLGFARMRPRLHPEDSHEIEFNRGNVEACLARATRLLESGDLIYLKLQEFMLSENSQYQDLIKISFRGDDFFEGYPNRGRFSRGWLPPDIFTRFEGGWKGKWSQIEAKHIWFSTHWNRQYVLISDDGVLQPAINIVDQDGTVCGIVRTENGDRIHEGRFFAGNRVGDPEYLKWMIPGQTFFERIVRDPKNQVSLYLIDQWLVDSHSWGVQAEYINWKSNWNLSRFIQFEVQASRIAKGRACNLARRDLFRKARSYCSSMKVYLVSEQILDDELNDPESFCTMHGVFACD